jgi:hybrid cluster-associated redox disulfide protein
MRFKIDIKKNINELLMEFPQIAEVLTYEYGLYCVNCVIAEFDTLEEGAKLHGIEAKDFKEMIEHLEEIINSDEENY